MHATFTINLGICSTSLKYVIKWKNSKYSSKKTVQKSIHEIYIKEEKQFIFITRNKNKIKISVQWEVFYKYNV